MTHSPEEAYAAALKAAQDIRWWGQPALSTDAILCTALASLRASGYVVVPVEPTEARLCEIGEEINIMLDLRIDDLDMARSLYLDVISGAPAFPPEADHG